MRKFTNESLIPILSPLFYFIFFYTQFNQKLQLQKRRHKVAQNIKLWPRNMSGHILQNSALPIDVIILAASFLEGADIVMLSITHINTYIALARESKTYFTHKINLQTCSIDGQTRNSLQEKDNWRQLLIYPSQEVAQALVSYSNIVYSKKLLTFILDFLPRSKKSTEMPLPERMARRMESYLRHSR